MNLSLPEPLKRFVEGKVSSGMYGSASEFVREAIREKFLRDQEGQRAKDVLTAKLLQGLSSGQPIQFTNSHFQQKKKALASRRGQKNRGG
jgi:antitoxin ParD1/3/4